MKLQLGSQAIAILMATAVFLYLMYSYIGISVSKSVIPDEIKGRVIHNLFPLTLFVPHEAPLNQNLKLIQWWTWQFIIIRSVFSAVIIYCRNWNWPDAVLAESSFCGANLHSAHLENTDLTNANLSGAILEQANLKEGS